MCIDPSLEMPWWTFGRETEWLSPTDAWLGHLLQVGLSLGDCLEIGVWRGAWSTVQLESVNAPAVFGIDPYPGLSTIRSGFLSGLRASGREERFTLYDSWIAHCENRCVTGHVKYGLIHVDGEHSSVAVERDLVWSMRHSRSDTVMAIDDVLNPSFPGVAAAMFPFLRDNGLSVLVQTDAKFYICRDEAHEHLMHVLKALLEKAGIVPAPAYVTGTFGETYGQSTAIYGREIVQLLGNPSLDKIISCYFPKPPLRRRLWRASESFLPPGIRKAVPRIVLRK